MIKLEDDNSFQFGCTGEAIIIFELDRLQVAEGGLDVLFTPFLTNHFFLDIPVVYVSPSGITTTSGVPAPIDPLPVVAGIGAVAVVIVVVLFVLKKKGKI